MSREDINVTHLTHHRAFLVVDGGGLGAANVEARIFVFFLACPLCEHACEESSFFLDLTGTVCLLRFDGTGFFILSHVIARM
jgi:hypothetical protein